MGGGDNAVGLHLKDGDRKFVRNIGTSVPKHTGSHLRRPYYTNLLSKKLTMSYLAQISLLPLFFYNPTARAADKRPPTKSMQSRSLLLFSVRFASKYDNIQNFISIGLSRSIIEETALLV